MNLPLDKLNYVFKQKPLLVGGMAMEYYGLRKSGWDIDLVVAEEDIIALIKKYPNRVKDLWGDLGVCPKDFEIWRTICYLDYKTLSNGAIVKKDFLVISLENLLFMKALGYKNEKYLKDVKLIADSILKNQGRFYEQEKKHNEKILHGIEKITYIEKKGPVKKSS